MINCSPRTPQSFLDKFKPKLKTSVIISCWIWILGMLQMTDLCMSTVMYPSCSTDRSWWKVGCFATRAKSWSLAFSLKSSRPTYIFIERVTDNTASKNTMNNCPTKWWGQKLGEKLVYINTEKNENSGRLPTKLLQQKKAYNITSVIQQDEGLSHFENAKKV